MSQKDYLDIPEFMRRNADPAADADRILGRRKHAHYFRDVSHLREIDVYRVLDLFNVTDPCLQHAIKKLLAAGVRGVKPAGRDVLEAVDTLQRWLEMRAEDERRENA